MKSAREDPCRPEREAQGEPDLGERLQVEAPGAYEEFLAVYPRRFYWYFCLRCGLTQVNAEQLAEKLLYDIIVSKLSLYRAGKGGGFHAWIKTLMKHAAADWFRQGAPETVSLREDLKCSREQDNSGEAAAAVPASPMELAVRDAIRALDDDDGEILELHDVRAMSFAEIGLALGLAEGTARVRHHRAKKRLRELLQNDSRVAPLVLRLQKGQ